ncbi:glycosyltransferase family 1 protein [Micromonospora phytophila]|uniref:glycosyltransferase n=1 Tax=Micromonospora phytophila TaxID=709888 RepID=UPI00202FFCB1|nr:glycosyltransferase family 1 protein [Micromonospora phytophila]MCM0675567.1 glycosyltransferase family 1 protein [Micromonospora phytophila]
MTNVLIVVGERPQQKSVLLEALRRFRDQGASVGIVGDFPADALTVDVDLADVHPLAATPADPRLRRALARTQQPSRALWLRSWRDPWVRRRVRTADVLVALDSTAIHTVWEMAQRQPRADACNGIGAAGRVVRARHEGTYRPTRGALDEVSARAGIVVRGVRRAAVTGAKESLEAAMAPAVLRSGVGGRLWRSAVSIPGLPERVRVALAYRVHLRSVQSGRPGLAAATTTAAAARMSSRRARADLLTREANGELDLGHVPVCLTEAVAAELALADEFLPKNKVRASRSLHKAMRLLFHRVPHFDQLSSPLAERPAEFLAPLRASTTARALAAPRGRATPAAAPPTGRPLRLLIMTNGNAHFLREIRQRYAETPGVELRYLHLADDPIAGPLTRNPGGIVEHLVAGQSEFGNRVEEWLRPHLDWADTLFVDWCVATAAITTLVDPGNTRVIMRLHSFEAFSFWPHLIDFSRVDDLVFVSEHLRDLTTEVVPALTGARAPRLRVIPNAMDLTGYQRPKDPSARFTLGLIGTSAVAKDPRWAIEVLRRLRATDERYRLLLVGGGLNPDASESVRHYEEALSTDLAELEPSGAVTRIGHVDDVPGVLSGIGSILSSSVRESFHCALVEGAASGAVPVVRDWPFFADRAAGARTLFPADWVVGSQEEAAARIRATTASEEVWRAEGAAAAEYATKTWDWTVVQHDFDELFLPRAGRQE